MADIAWKGFTISRQGALSLRAPRGLDSSAPPRRGLPREATLSVREHFLTALTFYFVGCLIEDWEVSRRGGAIQASP